MNENSTADTPAELKHAIRDHFREEAERLRADLKCERARMVLLGGDAVIAERMRADRAEAERDELHAENERLRRDFHNILYMVNTGATKEQLVVRITGALEETQP